LRADAGELFELDPMVEGEDGELGPVAQPRRRPVQVLEVGVEANARSREPWARKCCSSIQLGIAGAQPWRETTSAPQALA
jgi:hypothetical protein